MTGYKMGPSSVGQGLHYGHDFGGGEVQVRREKMEHNSNIFFFPSFSLGEFLTGG